MSDEDLGRLVEQARAELPHKLSAFEKLAQSQFGLIRGLAYGIVGDPDLAGGIAQDVLLRVMHALPRLEDVEKYPGWVRRITINVARSRLAKERREREKRASFARETDWVSGITEPAEGSFAELLDGLSVEEKTIVTLKIVDDLEFTEIAEITGIGVSATKMRYYRALEKIKLKQTGD